MNTPLSLEQENTIRSAVVLANAGEIACGIVNAIAGNDISTAIGGNRLTNELVQSLVNQRIVKRLAERKAA